MKRLYLSFPFFLAVTMVYVTAPVIAYHNLLQNPGFETGDFPPWEFYGNGTWGARINGTGGHSGNYYAELGAGIGEVWLRQEVNPPHCAMYLKFWYKSFSFFNITLVRIYYSDGSTQEEILDNALNEWTPIHINLDNRRRVEAVEIYTLLGGFEVDDFDLEACQPVGGELLTNNVSTTGTGIIALASIVGVSTGIAYRKRKTT